MVGMENSVRHWRAQAGLSQADAARAVGISRQALIGIESGRHVPSTSIALGLARALGCRVEDLFALAEPEGFEARGKCVGRVALGRVAGRWIAHALGADATTAADGLAQPGPGEACRVTPLLDIRQLESNVLVAGCAPLLGALLPRIGQRYRDATGRWIAANSGRALQLLEQGRVHVAGLHLFDAATGGHNEPAVRERFVDERMLLVNLTRWRAGLVVARGNPRGIRTVKDAASPDLQFAMREAGSGAAGLVERLVGKRAARRLAKGLVASGHREVARLVACGAADAGIAIETVALSAELDFIPLAEERFDLVLRADLAVDGPVKRLLDALDDNAFRAEAAAMPGYDASECGHVSTVGDA